MKTETVLKALATALVARANCEKSGKAEWLARWSDQIDTLCSHFLPSGSGFDCGTKCDVERSNGQAWIILIAPYHHMNENGMYDGWTEHEFKVTPNLLHGFDLKISGRDRNGFKEYAHDVFHAALTREIVMFPDGEIKAADTLEVSAQS